MAVESRSHNVSVRLDAEALAALRLLSADGSSQSDVIRRALIAAAERRRSRAALAAEAARLAADPDDQAEMRAVMRDMESLRAPW